MGVEMTQNYDTDMTERAARICRAYLPGAWKKITTSDVEVTRLSGGLSNWLYHVKLQKHVSNYLECNPREVLLRLYGQSHGKCGVEHLISESVIFALLSERKLGPRLYGVFPGGRIEEYIPARPMKLHELSDRKLSLLIAEKMAAIHSLNLPLTKEPSFLWDTCTRWLDEIGDVHALEHKNMKLKNLLKKDLYSEFKWLRSYLTKLHSRVVFCHNDMQEGNVLLKTTNQNNEFYNNDENQSPSLLIIDYEYCGYNYRSYELANHFIEWIFDYQVSDHPYFTTHPENYPSTQHQRRFIEHYLAMLGSNDSVDLILDEVKHFTLASHFLWSLWSLLNGKSSKITFGYWEYAVERLQMYYALKSQLLSNPPSNVLIPKTIRSH